MTTCHGCGGVIGRDCFNPAECEEITRDMARKYQEQDHDTSDALRQRIRELEEALRTMLNIAHTDDWGEFASGRRAMSAARAALGDPQ